MPRYIRYLENNEWKYASVKTVGDLDLLKTDNKEDLVSAINSLIDGGILETVQDNLDQIQGNVDSINSTVGDQSELIQTQQDLIDLLKKAQQELFDKADALKLKQDQVASDLEKAKDELFKKADVDYVDGQLVKKVDSSVHQQKYDEIESELREKVNLDQYQQEYAGIVEGLEQKANSIDLQSVVDSVNEDITNQTIEVDKAKTDIVNLDTKVDNVKSEVLTTIETVQSDADALDAKVAQQKSDLENKISATETKAKNDLAIAKSELNTAIGSVQGDVETLESEVESNKQELISKINTDVANANDSIEVVEGRVINAESNISKANTEISNAKQSITNTQSDLSATKQDLATTKQNLTNVKSQLDSTKVELQGEIESTNDLISDLDVEVDTKVGQVNDRVDTLVGRATKSEQDITGINSNITSIQSDIDTVEQTIASTQKNLSTTNQNLANTKTELKGSIDTVQGKAEANELAIAGVNGNIIAINNEIDEVKGQVSTTITDVEQLEGRVTTNESNVTQNAEEIATKVSKLDYDKDINGVKGRVTNTESTLVQHADLIASKVEKVDYDSLEGRVTNQQSSIEQMADSIAQKVEHDEYNELTQQVSSQETQILQSATDIQLLANRTSDSEGRLESAETSIKQNADAIKLKAEANSVYTKGETDGKLGSKVDSQTYSNKVAEIALTTDGIKQRVENTEGDIDGITGDISNIKSDVSSLDQTASQIQTTVKGVQSDVDGLDGRLDSAETQITQTKDSIALKADKTTVDTLTGRVNNAESSISQNAEQIATKVEKTTYTTDKTALQGDINSRAKQTALDATNKNLSGLTGRVTTAESNITQNADEIKTKVAQLDYDTDMNGVKTRISGAESSITQNSDAIATKVEQSEFNALDGRVDTAESTIVQHSDAIALKAEKSSVYTKGETDTKLGKKTDSTTFNNKMAEINLTTDGIKQDVSELQTTTDSQGTRISKAETTLTQQADQIALKASQLEVDEVSKDVDSVQAELVIQADKIASKVEKSDYDELNGRVANQQSTVEQLADSISQKVTHDEYDELTQQVSTQETSILQTASEVEILATKSEDIDGRLVNAESSITTQAGQIALKATQSEMDNVKGRVSKAEGDITTQAGQISLKASQSDMNSLTGRVSTAEGKITTQAGQINLKAEKKDVYTKSETDTKLGSKTDSSVYNDKMAEIDLTTDKITQRVTSTEGKLNTATGDITDIKSDVSSLEQTATQIQTTVGGVQSDVGGIKNRLTNAETQVTQNKNAIALKASQTDLDTVTGRVDDSEAQLEVQAGQISSKVAQTTYNQDKTNMQNDINSKAKQSDVSALTTRVSSAESSITQNAEAITSKVEQDDFDTLNGTVDSQGTTIAQHSSQIALKAEKSSVYTKGETDTKLGNKVDNTTYNNKMAELKVTTDGINQEVSSVKGTVNTQTGQITQLNKDVSSVDQKANSIQQQVNSVNTTVTDQGKTISSQGSSITQLNKSIDLKAEKTDVYTKAEADGKVNTAVSSAKAEIQVTTDGIKQDVSKVNATLGDHDGRLVNQQSSIEQLADSISQKVEYTEYDQTTQQMAVQETEILQTKSDITLLANRTSESEDRLSVAESSININSDAIESKVEKTDFNNLKGTVNAQGTTISQHSDAIRLKAEASSVYTKGETDTKLNSKVNSSTYNSKVAEIDLDIDGITQNVSNISSDLSTTKQNVSTVTQKANSIEQNVGSLSSTVTNQGKTITSQGSTISQLDSQIKLKAEASNVYTKSEADNKVSSAVNTAKSEIKLTTDGISQEVSKVDSKINDLEIGAENLLRNTATKKDASYIGLSTGVTRDTSFLNRGLNTFKYDISGLTSDAWRSANPSLFEAKEGEVFSASAEVYVPTGHSIDMSAPTLEMQFYKADGSRISALATSTSKPNLSKLDQWQKVTTENMKAPAGTVKANARVWVQRNGKIWVSHLMMNRGTKVADWSPSFLDTDMEFESVNQSISKVDQKADGISQSVSSLSSKVDGQGSRISNAETTISQHTTSINLKANATDVYKKTDVDGKLGGKVDTTTYNNKMSSIDVDVSGIKQTSSNQQTTISGIDGTVKSHTSQISTLDQRADGFDVSVREVQNDISGVKGRVSTAETNITANKDAIALKASSKSVSDLGTRVGTAEGKIEVNANQIAQRVTKTEMDNAVGVNQWIASKYDMNLGSSSAVPTFAHIKGKTPSLVIDYPDNARLQPFSGDYYLGHYFTNIYMETAKTINLSVNNDDGASIFLNGASIYGRGSTTTTLTVAVAFRAGWNTIEVLHYEHAGGEFVGFGLKLSDKVDKMTSVIGVGDKNETRLTQAESSIIQNADDISLRATKTEVTAMGNRVKDAESTLTIHTNQIASKVAQTDFNAYSQRVSKAESSITQLSDEITQKVNTTDYNLLNNSVKDQGTMIQQLNESIDLKVDEKVIDGIDKRITDSETQISLTKDQILLKANKTDLDEVTGRLSDAEASIDLQADEITQRVTKTEFDNLSVGARNWLTNSGDFKNLTGWKQYSSAYPITGLSLVDDSVYGKVVTATGDNINARLRVGQYIPYLQKANRRLTFSMVYSHTGAENVAFGGKYSTSDSTGEYDSFGGRNYQFIDLGNGYKKMICTIDMTSKSDTKSFFCYIYIKSQTIKIAYCKLEDGDKATEWTPAVEDVKGDLTELGDRMKSAETSINQTSEAITLKADKSTTYTKSDVDNKIGQVDLKISNQATELKQTNDSITLKANKTDVYTKTESGNLLANKTDKSDFNAIVTRVSNTESSLKVANDNIATKVAQSEFEVLNDKVALNSDSTNYNPNPSFEGKKSTGYTHTQAFASTDAGVPTGAPKKYVGRQTGRDNYINESFSVKGGDKFIVEGWIASTDSAQTFGLGLNAQDDAGNNTWLVSGHKTKGSGSWQYFKNTYTIPSDRNKARFFSQINAGSSFGNWYFTDVRVTKVIDQSQVDGLETKLSTMQTAIDQTSSSITLKANASDVYTKGQTDTKVNTKANQSDLNSTNSNVSGLTTRMTNAEASIKVQADKIESKVEKQEFNKLSIGARNYIENGNFANGTKGWSGFQSVSSVSVVDSAEYGKCLQVIADSSTSSRSPAVKANGLIDVTAGEEWTVSFWAKRSEAGLISCLMKFRDASNVESNTIPSISVNGAKDTWVYFSQTIIIPNGVVKMYPTPRVETSIASLKYFIANVKIEKGNRATDFSPNPKDFSDNIGSLEESMSNATTRITQTEKDIAIKANKTDVYTKTETNGNVSKAISDAKGEIKVTTDGISQNVSNLSTTVSGHTSTIGSHTTSINQLNNSITSKAEKSSVYTKAEADGKITTAVSSAKSEIKQTTDGITSTVSALDTKIGSISVGARNLLEGSGTDKYKKGIDDTMSGYNQYYSFDISHVDEKIEVGETLTISFDVQMQTGSYLRIYDTNAYKGKRFGENIYRNIGSKKIRLSWTFEVLNQDKGSSTHGLYFYNSDNGDKFTIERIKIEKGNIPTDWTQAPEDVDQRMDDITIGARNLLLGTGNSKTATGKGGTNETTNVYDLISKDYSLIAGKQVTVSFDIVFSVDSGTAVLQYDSTPWGYLADRVNASKTNKHYSFTKNLPADGSAKGIQLRLDGVTGTATVSNVKLEFGNKESSWSPAFEDINVGTRNKILNSSFKNGTTNWSSFSSTISVVNESSSPTGKAVHIVGQNDNGGIWYSASKIAPNSMESDKEYTTSIIAKGSGKLEFGIERLNSSSIIDLTSDYRKYTVTQYATSPQSVVFYAKNGANVYVHSIKLEEGNHASEWTPAIEDTDGEIDSLSTKINQTANEVSINVVKKNSILSSINASSEGVRIKGDKIDISGAVTFSSLNSDMQSKINAGTSAKTAIDNLDVGGTNMLTGTNFDSASGFYKWGSGTFVAVTSDSYVGFNYLRMETKDDSGNGLTVSKGTAIGIQTSGHTFRVIKGRQYTVSMIIATSELDGVLDYLYLMHGNGSSSMNLSSVNTYDFPYVSDVNSGSPATRGYYKVSYTFTADVTDDKAYILVGGRTTRDLSGSAYAWIRLAQLQVEEGNKATSWSLSPVDIANGVSSAISTASADATNKANQARRDAISETGSWISSYKVNTATILPLKDVNGNNLSDAYSYEVQARTTQTGTESTAIGYLLSKGDGAGWNLSIDYEMGSSSNHPKISINNGVPSISLYNHTTLYNVEVKLVAYRGRYLPSKKAQDDANGATSKANTAQSTANSATTKANNAQSTANTATTKADNAQSTANTANSTANYAKSTVDGGKSKWEGAYNLTQTWRRGNTTEIDGGNISTRSIQAQSMIMADFTNLCENPDFEYDTPNSNPMGFTGGSNYRVVDISAYNYGNGSNRALQIDASTTASSSSYMSKLIPVSAGQQFYVGAEGRYYNSNGSGTGRIGFKTYDGKQSSDNHWYTAVQWSGTKNQTFDYKSGTFTVPEGVNYLQVWISFSANDTANNSFIIDNIRIHRMANAELIVDGVIEGRHIKADSISFDKAKGGTLKLGGSGNVNGVLEVYSSDNELIANLDGDKGGFTSLYVADFESPTVVEYGSDNLSFYVSDRWLDYTNSVDPSDENSGNGWASPLATIAEALRRIPKYFDGTANIYLPYNGVFYENIDVMGFLGTGSIYISGGNGVRINGNIRAYKNLCSVYFKDFTVNGLSGSYGNVQLSQSPYINVENVKVYGNNSQRAFDVRENCYAQISNSEMYDVDYAICSRYGSTTYVYNCKGLGAVCGLYAYGGYITGKGTAPAGTKYSNAQTGDGGMVNSTFSYNTGSASPPPAPETTKSFSASSGNSWRDNYSGQWYNQGVVAQGYWGGYGVYRGLWFLGSSMSDTLKGKTIKSMRVYVKRTTSGGNSGSVTCYFRSHNYTSQPSGKPTLGDKYTTATFKWGEGKWINIPSSMWADFTSGTAKGIGIYVNSTSSNYYARFGTSIQVEVTYK